MNYYYIALLQIIIMNIITSLQMIFMNSIEIYHVNKGKFLKNYLIYCYIIFSGNCNITVELYHYTTKIPVYLHTAQDL